MKTCGTDNDWAARLGGAGQGAGVAARWGNVTEMARAAGLELDDQQRAVAEFGGRRLILNCSRQWGKSTLGALKALWEALHLDDEGLVLVAARTFRQAKMVVRKAKVLARRLGVKYRPDGDNPGSMMFENGARIVGIPGDEDSVRGFARVALMIIDEAAYVDDELYYALMPMLAVSNGTLMLMSTPGEPAGFFYKAWTRGGAVWERVKAAAWDCPRIAREFLEEQRKAMPKWTFAMEYECEFAGAGNRLFPPEFVHAWLRGEL